MFEVLVSVDDDSTAGDSHEACRLRDRLAMIVNTELQWLAHEAGGTVEIVHVDDWRDSAGDYVHAVKARVVLPVPDDRGMDGDEEVPF